MPKSFKEYVETKDRRVNELFGWGKKPEPQVQDPIRMPKGNNPFDKAMNLVWKLSSALQELPGKKYKLNPDSLSKFRNQIEIARTAYENEVASKVGQYEKPKPEFNSPEYRGPRPDLDPNTWKAAPPRMDRPVVKDYPRKTYPMGTKPPPGHFQNIYGEFVPDNETFGKAVLSRKQARV
jgi:hypothetical protein